MTIYYTTTPKTFSELVDSCRGQMERMREVAITKEKLPYEEHVVLTSESFLDTLENIERIHHSLWEQTQVNRSIQQLFLMLFEHLGIPAHELLKDDEDDDYDDDWDEHEDF